MIVLDTHAWIWWTHDIGKLSEVQKQAIAGNEDDIIGISAISFWEIAKAIEHNKLELPIGTSEWFDLALGYPGISILDLTPEIAMESTNLPGDFHKNPADQIIVATARVHRCELVSSDTKIVPYPHVRTIY